jgi:hypothetical protein
MPSRPGFSLAVRTRWPKNFWGCDLMTGLLLADARNIHGSEDLKDVSTSLELAERLDPVCADSEISTTP